MKLLDAHKSNAQRKQADQERAERIHKMQDEESSLVKRINDLRVLEEAEKKRIADDTSLAECEAETRVKKSVLLSEVNVLEKRKQEALKPLLEKEHAAHQLFEQAQKSRADAQSDREKIAELREIYEKKLDSFEEKEDKLVEKDHELHQREAGIIAAENEIKRSTGELSAKWTEFHKAVYAKSLELDKREKEVESGRKANEAIREEIEKEKVRVQEEDRLVRDKYAALAEAQKHLK